MRQTHNFSSEPEELLPQGITRIVEITDVPGVSTHGNLILEYENSMLKRVHAQPVQRIMMYKPLILSQVKSLSLGLESTTSELTDPWVREYNPVDGVLYEGPRSLVEKMMQDPWIEEFHNGILYIGPKSFVELQKKLNMKHQTQECYPD